MERNRRASFSLQPMERGRRASFSLQPIERGRRASFSLSQPRTLTAATTLLPVSEDMGSQAAPLVIESFNDLAKMTCSMFCSKLALVVAYFLVGIAIGHYKKWSVVFSLYFSVQTLTTVGYGDFSFKGSSVAMQLSVALFVVMGLLVMSAGLTVIFQEVFERERSAVDRLISQKPPDDGSSAASSLEAVPPPLTRTDVGFPLARRRLRTNLLLCLVAGASILVIGAAIVGTIEGWDWHTSFYWSCVTFTSVGYGDVVPTLHSSRVVAMILMLVGVVVLGSCAGFLGSYGSFSKQLLLEQRVMTQFGTELTGEELEILSQGEEVHKLGLCSSEHCITRAEFSLFMLVKLGRVSEEELKASQEAFDCLDVTRTGILDKRDLEVHERLREHRTRRMSVVIENLVKDTSVDERSSLGDSDSE